MQQSSIKKHNEIPLEQCSELVHLHCSRRFFGRVLACTRSKPRTFFEPDRQKGRRAGEERRASLLRGDAEGRGRWYLTVVFGICEPTFWPQTFPQISTLRALKTARALERRHSKKHQLEHKTGSKQKRRTLGPEFPLARWWVGTVRL